MFQYRNDRHRCEIAFVARILYIVVISSLKSSNQEELAKIEQISLNAVLEPLMGLDAKHQKRLKNRINRMEFVTMNPLCQHAHSEKIVLVAYYFINQLVDEGYMSVPEGSALAITSDYLLALIDIENPVTQKRMKTAEKDARKWREILSGMGYFN